MTADPLTAEDLVEQLLNAPSAVAGIAASLGDDVADAVIERLKQEADRYWSINANHSLEIADIMMAIGSARSNRGMVALGLMARGDALKLLGRISEAWDTLEHAGQVFLDVGDHVGWARTRIGRLWVGYSLGKLDDALIDVEPARRILEQHQEAGRIVGLDYNLALVFQMLGHHDEAIPLYLRARAGCDALGDAWDSYRGAIATNLGMIYSIQGDLRRALQFHQEAIAIFDDRGEQSDAADARLNLSDVYLQQGRYPEALKLLYDVRAFYTEAELPRHAAEAGRSLAEANLQLNRFEEAHEAAMEALTAFRGFDASFAQAQTLLLLGTIEAHRRQLEVARRHFAEARETLARLNAPAWAAVADLGQAQVALAQGDLGEAETLAITAGDQLANAGLEIHGAEASLVRARVRLATGDHTATASLLRAALHTARHCGVPTLRYSALVLWARLWEARERPATAVRAYNAASSVVERVDRALTITLRPGFLESRREASTRLFQLNLQLGRVVQAWTALERTKAHTLGGYLHTRGAVHWQHADGNAPLQHELAQLREEQHHLLLQITSIPDPELPDPHHDANRRAAQIRLLACERRIRELSEQVHLLAGTGDLRALGTVPTVDEVCAALDDSTIMIEYGSDGEHTWAFVLDRKDVRVFALDVGAAQISQTLNQLHANFSSALRLGPERSGQGLNTVAHGLLLRLDRWLRQQLPIRWQEYERIVFVPFGPLHYLPFHLLHDGTSHVLTRHEITVVPAAALAPRLKSAPTRLIRALAIAYSDGGRLPGTVDEASMVASTFPGACFVEDQATTSVLKDAWQYPIVHVAAHGEHRPDAPEFSYVRLADGLLQADDLFQLDLKASLVVLSACETGRAVVAPGDDLIGLGRGLLYAGARSLVLSQWRADDATTLSVMRSFYQELARGARKADALRTAQASFASGRHHPAFWGSFQIVGEGGYV